MTHLIERSQTQERHRKEMAHLIEHSQKERNT